MLALLLAKNIVTLFVYVLLGVLLVRFGILKESDGKPLSTLLIYILSPAIIVTSLEVGFSYELAAGMALAVVAAVCMQLLAIGIGRVLAGPLRLTNIEKGSVGYSNSANLLIPLIIATLGQEWVIYSLAYVVVSLLFMFSHLETLVSEKPVFRLRDFLLNPNMIAVAVGVVLLVTGLRLPAPFEAAADGLGSMLGPVAMLVAGMNIGAKKAKDVFANKRVWMTTALRLILVPLISCAILRFAVLLLGILGGAVGATGAAGAAAPLVSGASEILLCTLLATSAPCASMVVQFAMLYDKDAPYASAINAIGTLSCIITMPLMVALYLL